MKWLLAAAIVIIALTYCIEATVDDSSKVVISSSQYPTTQYSSINSAFNSIINDRGIDLKKSSNNISELDERDLIATQSDIRSNLGSLLVNGQFDQNDVDQLPFANSNSGSDTNSKDTESDIYANIKANMDYISRNSPSNQNNANQLLLANSNSGSDTNPKSGYVYENSRTNKGAKKRPISNSNSNIYSNINKNMRYISENNQPEKDVEEAIEGFKIASRVNSKRGYLYENRRPDEKIGGKVSIASPDLSSDIDSELGNLYRTTDYYRNDNGSPEKALSTQGLASIILSNLDRICTQTGPILNSRSDEFSANHWFDDTGFHPVESSISNSLSNVFINLPMQWNKKSYNKNYAVVVGINSYEDRKGLSAPVNDANCIGSILKSLGYEVITLTDVAENRPTKHNILEGALKEISLKKNRGNVVLYFSGHGEVDKKGNFYIIPQDGKGDLSSYISEDEINQYLKGMKNLAIIIDACNSGAFKVSADEDQLILTSSKENEPSNENWTAPVSVFTYYLCQSIEKDNKANKGIIMQEAFNRAKNDTLMWSSNHLVRQTPSLVGMTNGQYYLN